MKSTVIASAAAVVAAASPARHAACQQQIPVGALATAAARTPNALGAVLSVRQLPGGRVLVSDGRRRQLLLFDSTLTHTTIVLDSAAGIPNAYGPRPSPVIAYTADSSIFVDITAQALLLIDPAGKVARVMSAPNPRDLFYMANGAAGVDIRGRLVFRGAGYAKGPDGNVIMTSLGPAWSTAADSIPILRADFQLRTVDTVTHLQNLLRERSDFKTTANGERTLTFVTNPVPMGDEWAITSDGVVAVVRGHDYHVDWIAPDGRVTASAKLPFDWKRLTDADKQRIVDSARAARDSQTRADANQRTPQGIAGSGGRGAPVSADGGRGGGGGMGAPVAATRDGAPSIASSNAMHVLRDFVPVGEMPDYLPPIRAGAVKADLDGNIWILPTTSAQSIAGELVYDVVNRRGELFERVRVPVGHAIVGFGTGGVVFLTSGNLTTGFVLERTRIVP